MILFRLIPVPVSYARRVRAVVETKHDTLTRIKLMLFNLTEYRRIQYISTGMMLLRNIDSLFLKNEDYDNKLLLLMSDSGLPSTHYMSLTPNPQVLADLMFMFIFNTFSLDNGWLDYGSYIEFHPKYFIPKGFEFSNHEEIDSKFPELVNVGEGKLLKEDVEIFYGNWSFQHAYSDRGAILYYFYFLKKSMIVLSSNMMRHYIFHFAVDKRPWNHKHFIESEVSLSWKSFITLWKSHEDSAFRNSRVSSENRELVDKQVKYIRSFFS